MSSAEFARITRELYAINETVQIVANANSVKFSVTNETIGGGFTYEPNDSDSLEQKVEITSDTTVDLSFALRYLTMFTKASTVGQQVSLYLSKEFPLMVEYKLASLGVLKFYLAPRISDNEEK